jgi:hypothetical protein
MGSKGRMSRKSRGLVSTQRFTGMSTCHNSQQKTIEFLEQFRCIRAKIIQPYYSFSARKGAKLSYSRSLSCFKLSTLSILSFKGMLSWCITSAVILAGAESGCLALSAEGAAAAPFQSL